MGTREAIQSVLDAIHEIGPATAAQIERHPAVAQACRDAKLKARKLIERLWREGKLQAQGEVRRERFSVR